MTEFSFSDNQASSSQSRSSGFKETYVSKPIDVLDIKKTDEVPKTYIATGWFKPDNTDIVTLIQKAARGLIERDYTFRVSAGELTQPVENNIIRLSPPMKVYKPWKSYENNDVEINEQYVSGSEPPNELFEYLAHYDAEFNSRSRGIQVFNAAFLWSILGDDLKTPPRFILLHTWGRELKPSDITEKTNKKAALAIKVADDLQIPLYNLNEKQSKESFAELLNQE